MTDDGDQASGEGVAEAAEGGETVQSVANAAEVAFERSRMLAGIAGLLLDKFGAAEGESPERTIKNQQGRAIPATPTVLIALHGELARWAEQEELKAALLMSRPVARRS